MRLARLRAEHVLHGRHLEEVAIGRSVDEVLRLE